MRLARHCILFLSFDGFVYTHCSADRSWKIWVTMIIVTKWVSHSLKFRCGNLLTMSMHPLSQEIDVRSLAPSGTPQGKPEAHLVHHQQHTRRPSAWCAVQRLHVSARPDFCRQIADKPIGTWWRWLLDSLTSTFSTLPSVPATLVITTTTIPRATSQTATSARLSKIRFHSSMRRVGLSYHVEARWIDAGNSFWSVWGRDLYNGSRCQ